MPGGDGRQLNLRVNGNQTATSQFATMGKTSNTFSGGGVGNSIGAGTGSDIGSIERCQMHLAGIIIASGDSPITTADKSRIERYLGLLCNKDIPIVS